MGSAPIVKPTNSTARIAAILHERMHEMGVGQVDLAERIGSNQSSVQRWIAGTRSIPLEHFLAACKALGLDPGEVIRKADG